jgi:hypothetical protein
MVAQSETGIQKREPKIAVVLRITASIILVRQDWSVVAAGTCGRQCHWLRFERVWHPKGHFDTCAIIGADGAFLSVEMFSVRNSSNVRRVQIHLILDTDIH